MNDRSAIDEIRTRLDIVDVIGETVALKKTGGTYKGLCPFHGEKSPSFNVNRERGLFKCFGCGESGDIFSFVMKTTGITFPEALRELARRAGVILKSSGKSDSGLRDAVFEMNAAALAFFTNNLAGDHGAEARAYLAKRGVDDAMIRRFQIGLALASWDEFLKTVKNRFPVEALKVSGLVRERESGGGFYDLFRDRIIFPIFDVAARPVAFGAREYRGEEKGPKYINSPETPLYTKGRHLYALNLAKDAIKRSGRAVLVEGYTDVILAHHAGFTNVIAALGTALTDEQVATISRLGREIVLAYDMDAAGQKAADRGIDIALNRGLTVRVADLPEGEDPADTIKRDSTVFAHALDAARDFLDHRIEARLKTASSAVERAHAAKELAVSLSGVTDRVVRAALIHTIAERFGIPETALLAESEAVSAKAARAADQNAARSSDAARGEGHEKRGSAHGASVTSDASKLKKVARGLDPELSILRLMLDDREIRARAANDLEPGDFSKPVRSSVFSAILEAAANGEDLRGDLGGRVEGLGLELLAHIATAAFEDGDRARLYSDYRKSIRMQGIDARITDCTVQVQRPGLDPVEKTKITMRLRALLEEKKAMDRSNRKPSVAAPRGAGTEGVARHE